MKITEQLKSIKKALDRKDAIILLVMIAGSLVFSFLAYKRIFILFTLDEENIKTIYSVLAQVTASLYALIFTGYIFFRGEIRRSQEVNDIYQEVFLSFLHASYLKIVFLSILVLATVILSVGCIIWNQLSSFFYLLLLNSTGFIFLFSLATVISLMIALIHPNVIENFALQECNTLFKGDTTIDRDFYIRNYMEIRNDLSFVATSLFFRKDFRMRPIDELRHLEAAGYLTNKADKSSCKDEIAKFYYHYSLFELAKKCPKVSNEFNEESITIKEITTDIRLKYIEKLKKDEEIVNLRNDIKDLANDKK